MQEIFEFIKWIWDLRTLLIVGLVVVVLVLFYDKIIGVVAHHKEVFGKGGKKDD